MSSAAHPPTQPRFLRRCTAFGVRIAAAVVCAAPMCGVAWAQYKVVQPDGSVAYTDRPPVASAGKVVPMGAKAQTAAAAAAAAVGASGPTRGEAIKLSTLPLAGLPTELRNAAQRYPVTLYASTDCGPCDAGRQLLQKRGVPFLERKVTTDDDLRVFERQFSTRTMPFLTVGPQQLRGYSMNDWINYLEAAGYPTESKLPKGWKAPEATQLAEKTPPPPPAAPETTVAATPAPRSVEPPRTTTPSLRF
jgi:glutaredoxin